jgi:hypothetical protein
MSRGMLLSSLASCLGKSCSDQRQQPGDLHRVDPGGRVAAAPPQGVTNHPEGGVAPERPLGGRGLGGVAALLGKAPYPAGGQHGQLGVGRVVPDRLPVG